MNKTRSRSKVLLIAAIFLAPLVAAFWLHASGWKPPASRNHGYLYAPARDFRGMVARDEAGKQIVWENTERRWHLLLIAPPDCDARCAGMLDTVRRVWVGLGRHAADVDLHFVGTPDTNARAALAAQSAFDVVSLTGGNPLPSAAANGVGLPVYLIDPHGYLVMRFDAGFEPGGLRRDLQRLLR